MKSTVGRVSSWMAMLISIGCNAGIPTADDQISDSDEKADEAGMSIDYWVALENAKDAILKGETQIDLNGDGIIDYRRAYDASGRLQKEEIDENGDGIAERIWDYSGAVKTYTIDVNQDGKPEYQITVTPSSPELLPAKVVITADSNADGKMDTRKSYVIEKDSDFINVRVEIDKLQDGQFSFAYETIANRFQHSSAKPPLSTIQTIGTFACSESQKAAIESALADAVRKGISCLMKMEPGLALAFAKTIAGSNFTIDCRPAPQSALDACARMDPANSVMRFFGYDDLIINTFPHFFTDDFCKPFESTIFHEILHYLLGVHEIRGGQSDPADRVWGCERTCFGEANTQTCAACLGTFNGDKRCSQMPLLDCSNPTYYCPKDRQFYSSATRCAVACPRGLGGFGVQCQVRGPCGAK